MFRFLLQLLELGITVYLAAVRFDLNESNILALLKNEL
jgi:hypothetical protein